jgi:hypothetical protein
MDGPTSVHTGTGPNKQYLPRFIPESFDFIWTSINNPKLGLLIQKVALKYQADFF